MQYLRFLFLLFTFTKILKTRSEYTDSDPKSEALNTFYREKELNTLSKSLNSIKELAKNNESGEIGDTNDVISQLEGMLASARRQLTSPDEDLSPVAHQLKQLMESFGGDDDHDSFDTAENLQRERKKAQLRQWLANEHDEL